MLRVGCLIFTAMFLAAYPRSLRFFNGSEDVVHRENFFSIRLSKCPVKQIVLAFLSIFNTAKHGIRQIMMFSVTVGKFESTQLMAIGHV